MWARLCHLGVTRVVLCSTRSGLPVSHRAGDLRAELEGSLLRFIANAAWVTCIAPKTAESLFELILAHRARQKCGPSLGVGMKPTAANQLKRGGFLEVRPKQSHCRVGSNPQSAPNRRRCFDRLAFKKTCPCVPSRAGVAQYGRQRTDPTRSLGGSFLGIARLSKGSTGFLARDRNPSRSGS